MSVSNGPPHWRWITSTRQESHERVAGFPCYEITQDPGGSPERGKSWRLNARAHFRSSTTWHRNAEEARRAAREDYERGPATP